MNNIKIGSTFTTPSGHTVEIKDITIDVCFLTGEPTTQINYDFKTAEGREGNETNEVKRFITEIITA